jgi:hypothetical protein
MGCDVESGMAKKRPSSAADYGEIVIQRKGRAALNGEMWVADGLLTVRSSDGRQKTAQVGNSRPAGLARLMLLELEEEHLHGGPLSHSPETTE